MFSDMLHCMLRPRNRGMSRGREVLLLGCFGSVLGDEEDLDLRLVPGERLVIVERRKLVAVEVRDEDIPDLLIAEFDHWHLLLLVKKMEEGAGFGPAVRFHTPLFKSGAINQTLPAFQKERPIKGAKKKRNAFLRYSRLAGAACSS